MIFWRYIRIEFDHKKMNPDKKISILIITPTLNCGGAEKYVSLLCNHINTDKFEVCLLVLDLGSPFYRISNPAIEVINARKKRVRHALFAIQKLLKQRKPDLVYTTANHLNLLLAMNNWTIPVKTVLCVYESSIVSNNSQRAQFPRFYNVLMKIFYKWVDAVVCQSRYMQQDLIDHYYISEKKTRVINNPVERSDMALISSDGQFQRFITVARLSAEKGIDRLIRIMAKLKFPFEYQIIGDGADRAALQILIDELSLNDRVFLKGQQDDPYAGSTDGTIMLMGSHYEGFPNVLLEAGAWGIPVIAFDAPGGIAEIIVDGKNGLLVKNNDESAFAEAINTALQMKFDRDWIRQDNRERFSIDAIIDKTERLFEELVGGRAV
jgi:glycosyltransferase involved in cell wall biosynthesis